MALTHHLNPKVFAQTVVPWLLEQEAYNNLPLGLVMLLQKRAELVEKALMLTLSDTDCQLMAVATRPAQLVIAETPGAEALIPELADWLASHMPGLQGIVAPTALAQAFADSWQARTDRGIHHQMAQRVYQLRQVNPPEKMPQGHYRLAGLGDLNLLLEWTEAFIAEALPQERPSRDGIRAATLRQIEAQDIGLWERNNHPVSMAARTRPTHNGTAVSLVYSPPELRGQGYASACVAALSQAQLEAGKQFCCLFTDLANPTSNHIYQRIGYQPVGDMQVLEFGNPS